MSRDSKEDLYAVLGVDPKSSADDISRAHKKLAFEHHPDKAHLKKKDAAEEKADEMLFTRITHAYQVLSDPIERAQYDIAVGHVQNTPEERARLNRLKRADAERAIVTMEETVNVLRLQQHNAHGLLIVEAHYGDLSASTDEDTLSHIGRSIDVTVPLQMLVDVQAKQLVIHGGQSKTVVDGFYDPIPGEPRVSRKLYVRYLYMNQLHETVVGDRDALILPLVDHRLNESADPTVPNAGANLSNGSGNGNGNGANGLEHRTIQAQIAIGHALAATKRRRRWIFLGALSAIAGATYLWATDRLTSLPSLSIWPFSSASTTPKK